MRPGSAVLLHLINPTEKFWGVLDSLEPVGVVMRGINLSSFDDWMAQAVRKERRDQGLGLVTMFVPLFRVERVFLDEQVGEVESYRQRFLRRVGVSIEEYLGLPEAADAAGAEIPS